MNKKKCYILLSLLFLIFLFKIYYNNDFNAYNKLEEKNKIIAMIFAGRKKYLDILMIYLNNLYKNKKIHEIHFWQFTKNPDDIQYLESISNIHKTSTQFTEFRNIFPKIEDNKFLIGIKSTNGGAYLLLNNKYEIILNINNSNYSILKDKNKKTKILSKGSKIPNDKYLYFSFEIINHHKLLVKEKSNILFKYIIEDDSFISVKIHSEKDSENFWDYKEIKNQHYKLFDSEYREGKYWYEAYKYYLTYEYDILIKMDDDIVFIDINRFDEFIKFYKDFC